MLRSLAVTRVSCAAAAVLALGFAFAPPADAENRKHHLTLGLGYQKFMMDDELPSFDVDPGPGVDMRTFDFSGAGAGYFAYRLSLKETLDFTVDSRVAVSTVEGSDITLATSYFGPGVRFISPSEGIRPYAQVNFLIVSEHIEQDLGNNTTLSNSETGVGFGVSAGIDIHAGNLITIPIEGFYVYGKPEDDVSGLGFLAGITFNFGTLK
jgi:opacity protein-like surface antigen